MKFLAIVLCAAFMNLSASTLEIPDSALSNAPELKQQIFAFVPMLWIPNQYVGLGVSYRLHESERAFYDVSAFQKRAMIPLFRDNLDSYQITVSKGIQTKIEFLQFYVLGGAGFNYSEVTSGSLNSNYFALLDCKAGLSFNFGFIDVGFAIPFPSFTYHYSEVTEDGEFSTKITALVMSTARCGFGWTF